MAPIPLVLGFQQDGNYDTITAIEGDAFHGYLTLLTAGILNEEDEFKDQLNIQAFQEKYGKGVTLAVKAIPYLYGAGELRALTYLLKGGSKEGAKAGANAAKTARVGELIPTHGKTMSNKQLDKLTKNIRAEGIKEPLTVTEHQNKLYILDGHHRALAAPRAGVLEVPINKVELPFGAYKTPNDLIFSPGGY